MALTGYEKPLEQYTRNELIEIASAYTVSYQNASGQTSTAYSRLSKSKLIQIIKKDPDYIESNPKFGVKKLRPRKRTKQEDNRILPILRKYKGTEKADDLMNTILDAIKDTNIGNIPVPGKFYTYIYYAKTPKITYDRYPLIRAVEILDRGFIGYNAHWGDYRRYNTNDSERLVSGLHEVNAEEFRSLLYISYAKFIRNS